MREKRISGIDRGGLRRHGDPPAWLDQTLPLEERRTLLDRAIRIARTVQPQPQPQPAERRPDGGPEREQGDAKGTGAK